jgi:hypothetical protein
MCLCERVIQNGLAGGCAAHVLGGASARPCLLLRLLSHYDEGGSGKPAKASITKKLQIADGQKSGGLCYVRWCMWQ